MPGVAFMDFFDGEASEGKKTKAPVSKKLNALADELDAAIESKDVDAAKNSATKLRNAFDGYVASGEIGQSDNITEILDTVDAMAEFDDGDSDAVDTGDFEGADFDEPATGGILGDAPALAAAASTVPVGTELHTDRYAEPGSSWDMTENGLQLTQEDGSTVNFGELTPATNEDLQAADVNPADLEEGNVARVADDEDTGDTAFVKVGGQLFKSALTPYDAVVPAAEAGVGDFPDAANPFNGTSDADILKEARGNSPRPLDRRRQPARHVRGRLRRPTPEGHEGPHRPDGHDHR
jgi:hypothetical protein